MCPPLLEGYVVKAPLSKHPDYPLRRHTLAGGDDNEVEISRDYHSGSDAHIRPLNSVGIFKNTKHGPVSLQKITGRPFRECQVGLIPRKLYVHHLYKPLRV